MIGDSVADIGPESAGHATSDCERLTERPFDPPVLEPGSRRQRRAPTMPRTMSDPHSVRNLSAVEDGDTVWMEWRMWGTRSDETPMEFVGVNIFTVEDDQFRWGRIYTELVRDAGGIQQQLERMTQNAANSGETPADPSA